MDIKKILAELTLEEKAGLCSGDDFWHLKGVERLGVPSVMICDGPNGLRKQNQAQDNLGINDSIRAVCYPSACATACSFDPALMYRMGEALGKECQAEEIAVLLGPGANIKRSPLCGRNFEYFSEDPYLSSQMASAFIQGVQSQGVGTSLKHFLANNQEHRRLTVDAQIDERTLREIYLASFETAVQSGKPWTVMCSYNRLNGEYVSQDRRVLTDILREEWGFDGMVVSDWSAVNDRVKGLLAGLDLEMPTSYGVNDQQIVEAVRSGSLKDVVLDAAVERILTLINRHQEQRRPQTVFSMEEHHALAREIERESIVLLKNEDGLLPLSKQGNIAFLGRFAETPRFQGGGSAHVNACKVVGALEAAERDVNIRYAPAYSLTNENEDGALLAEAVKVAKEADCAVIFAGLPDSFESEGFDRTHMDLPENQNRLIQEVCRVQPNTVVVLHNGAPVCMPWIAQVKAVLEAYLGGQAVGEAVVDILFGAANPCGHLAESFPIKLSDNPSYLNFPGEKDRVEYREGIFVGYRYYDKKEIEVLFPFGHGLSYTEFEISNLRLSAKKIREDEPLTVTARVKNIGARAGKAVVQLYVRDVHSTVIRPDKELKGFRKVFLEAGEETEVTFPLNRRAFSYYNTEICDWHVESGEFEILLGQSSREPAVRDSIEVEGIVSLPKHYDRNSTLGDLLCDEHARPIIQKLMKEVGMDKQQADFKLGEGAAQMKMASVYGMPLHKLVSSCDRKVTWEEIGAVLKDLGGSL